MARPPRGRVAPRVRRGLVRGDGALPVAARRVDGQPRAGPAGGSRRCAAAGSAADRSHAVPGEHAETYPISAPAATISTRSQPSSSGRAISPPRRPRAGRGGSCQAPNGVPEPGRACGRRWRTPRDAASKRSRPHRAGEQSSRGAGRPERGGEHRSAGGRQQALAARRCGEPADLAGRPEHLNRACAQAVRQDGQRRQPQHERRRLRERRRARRSRIASAPMSSTTPTGVSASRLSRVPRAISHAGLASACPAAGKRTTDIRSGSASAPIGKRWLTENRALAAAPLDGRDDQRPGVPERAEADHDREAPGAERQARAQRSPVEPRRCASACSGASARTVSTFAAGEQPRRGGVTSGDRGRAAAGGEHAERRGRTQRRPSRRAARSRRRSGARRPARRCGRPSAGRRRNAIPISANTTGTSPTPAAKPPRPRPRPATASSDGAGGADHEKRRAGAADEARAVEVAGPPRRASRPCRARGRGRRRAART